MFVFFTDIQAVGRGGTTVLFETKQWFTVNMVISVGAS